MVAVELPVTLGRRLQNWAFLPLLPIYETIEGGTEFRFTDGGNVAAKTGAALVSTEREIKYEYN